MKTVGQILCELIAIPSVNPMGRDLTGPEFFESRVSDWLVDFFRGISAQHERIEVAPGRANVIARFDSPSSDLTLLLDAHQDTIPVDGMTIAPFAPRVENGRITGRGATDVKGGMAAMLVAFRRLVQEKPPGAANIILSCTCDEEFGTIGINDLVQCWKHPAGRSRIVQSPSDGAIIAEPTLLDVVIAHRGVTRFKVRTRGVAAHSSDPSKGVNAIYKMAKVVNAFEAYGDALKQTVKPHVLCGSAAISVGLISGGVSVNSVPAECVIEVDRRVIPGEQDATVLAALQAFVKSRVDFEVEFEEPFVRSLPVGEAGKSWLAEPLLDRIARVAGPRKAIGVPFCTHASQTTAGGIPSVVFGPGSIEQAHTLDEFIEIDQLEKAAEIYYQICANPPRKP